ncbi:heme binding protein [Perilla frutescens var. hirtella]|uniref:Heme binding protein n=1 Tax=Perilla frutescens var. hirtella TaxID=608512 RepID=A0AAD4P2M6_PERFH|nr:heme binding protein [Perilla frutescens var. hirtella]
MLLRPQSLLLLIAAVLFDPARIGRVKSHQESGPWHCDSDAGIRIQSVFRPGIITVDGKVEDWKDVSGSDFALLPALDPDADKAYNAGKMTLKVVHDGNEAFFMLQIDGNYAYTQGDSTKCASVALMLQIGENATYHRMGGCEEEQNTCTNKTCLGHEVDIMHFSLGNAIPGRLYGRNSIDNRQGYGGDRFGNLNDVYAWNPHCRYLDGLGPSGNDTTAQNDWQGSWWHSSLTDHSGFIKENSPYASEGQKGTYYFEFSRPLRTKDSLQQDAQFTIGKSNKVSAAFWYPEEGKSWHGSAHYSISCDWILLDFVPAGSSELSSIAQSSSWNFATSLSLFFSVVALCLSMIIGHRLSTMSRTANFIPMENL